MVSKSKIGTATIALTEYADGEEHAVTVQLKKGEKQKEVGELSITIQLVEPAKLSKA